MKIKDIEKMSISERLEYMNKLIPHLEEYPMNRGYEGCVYFINNDLVMKQFDTKKDYEILELVFESYCEESNKFEAMGYSIPKIFSWLRIPKKRPLDKRLYDFYILEQRMPGKNMFIGKLEDIYENFSDQYSKLVYNQIILTPERFMSDFKFIAQNYIQKYIEMNQIIESMSVRQLEKFIETVYGLYVKAEYNVPDVHAKNVIFARDSLSLVDNFMCKKKSLVYLNRLTAYEFMLSRIIILFRQNSYVGDIKRKYCGDLYSLQIDKMIDENMNLCASSLKKMVLAMQRCCEHCDLITQDDYKRAYNQLVKYLDDQKAKEVLSSFEISKY